MAILPLDEETKRRLMMMPGMNPDPPLPPPATNRPLLAPVPSSPGPTPTMMPGKSYPSSLPEMPEPRPLPMLGRGGAAPSGSMPGPIPAPIDLAPPTRLERLKAEQEGFMRGTPGRGRSGVMGALRGFAQGIATGGGLGAGLGGALAGGIYGGVDPRGLREIQFNERMRPKILERFAMEDEEQARQAAAIKATNDQAMNRLQMTNLQGQIDDRKSAATRADAEQRFKERQPLVFKPGDYVIPRTGGEGFQVPMTTKPPTTAEQSIDPESGVSVEQIANDSFIGRGGEQYVFDRLDKRTQQLLNGDIADASPAEIMNAQRVFENAIKKEKADILQYTKGEVRSKVLGRGRKGAPSQAATPSQGGTRRNLKDLTSLWK